MTDKKKSKQTTEAKAKVENKAQEEQAVKEETANEESVDEQSKGCESEESDFRVDPMGLAALFATGAMNNAQMPKLIYKKIHAIMSDAGKVGKAGEVSFPGTKYNYQKAEDIVNEIRKHMINHDVIVFPVNVEREDFNPELPLMSNVDVVYRFVAVEDGSFIDVPMTGSGTDKGDKGIYKALTGAFKYLLKQTLMIETGEDDYDKDASEANPSSGKQVEATGSLNGTDYERVKIYSTKAGKDLWLWAETNNHRGSQHKFWGESPAQSDAKFAAAGGAIDGAEESQQSTKKVSSRDIKNTLPG